MFARLSNHRTLALLALALAIAVVWTSCSAKNYSAEPTNGWLVDKATGEPIAGAVVVGVWVLRGGLEGHSPTNMKVLEATTDTAGHFALRGWGPERVPSTASFGAWMRDDDPVLYFFHPRYQALGLSNYPAAGAPRHPSMDSELRTSKHTGTKVGMVRIDEGDLKARQLQIDLAQHPMLSGGNVRPIHETMPNYCAAVLRESRRLNAAMQQARRTAPALPGVTEVAEFDWCEPTKDR